MGEKVDIVPKTLYNIYILSNKEDQNMKLVINTQYRENYAAHNEDFVPGVSADYWKFKGGSTYVVENIMPAQAMKIGVHGIPNLEKLVTYSNSGSEEYILDYNIVEDDAVVCEEWETPIVLKYAVGKWSALKFTTNGDMGYMRSEIHAKSEQWDLLPESDRENYSCQFKVDNGWFESNDPQLKIELARAA
jgi:hypothetical protein